MRMDELGSADIALFGGFRFDRRTGGLFRLDETGGATRVVLGARALALLALLIGRSGELLTKDEILAVVWPGRVVEEANLNVQISKLRRILDQDRAEGSCIQTVTGYGYRFTAVVSLLETTILPKTRATFADAGDGAAKGREASEPGVLDGVGARPASRT